MERLQTCVEAPRYEVGPGVTCLSLKLRSCPLASGAEPDETTYRSPFVEVPACWKKVGYPLTRLVPMVLVKQGCHLTMEHALVLSCPVQSNSVCIVSSLIILAHLGSTPHRLSLSSCVAQVPRLEPGQYTNHQNEYSHQLNQSSDLTAFKVCNSLMEME